MARFQSIRLFPAFVQTNKPNFSRISELTRRAMGNRTICGFAEECNLSKTTISRILNMQLKTPLVDEIIDAIVKNSIPNSGVTLVDFLEANGLTPKTENKGYDDVVVKKDMAVTARPEYAERFERAGIELIENYFVKYGFGFSQNSSHELRRILNFAFDVEYNTDALSRFGITQWCFDFCYCTNTNNIQPLFDKLNRIFAMAFLFNDIFKNKAITVVTNCIDAYREVTRRFGLAECAIPVSVIFVDAVAGKILKEYQIPSKNPEIDIEILRKRG